MKRLWFVVWVATTITATTAAVDPLEEGVEAGRFTQDYAAAIEYAREEGLPLFLNFTGSDWCGWCQLMTRRVFSKAEWSDYCEESIVLVTLDFPQDQSIVPEQYRDRNQRLQQQFEVRGYPTYIVLDSDGTTELGRLGAGRNKTAESFIAETEDVLRYSIGYLDEFSERLSGDKRGTFARTLAALKEFRDDGGEDERRRRQLRGEIDHAFREYVFDRMTDAEQTRYSDADEAYNQAARELNEWLGTKPEQNEENNAIYAEFRGRLDRAQGTIRALEAEYLP